MMRYYYFAELTPSLLADLERGWCVRDLLRSNWTSQPYSSLPMLIEQFLLCAGPDEQVPALFSHPLLAPNFEDYKRAVIKGVHYCRDNYDGKNIIFNQALAGRWLDLYLDLHEHEQRVRNLAAVAKGVHAEACYSQIREHHSNGFVRTYIHSNPPVASVEEIWNATKLAALSSMSPSRE